MAGLFGIEVLIILLLIVANGFFAASELAIVSVRRSRLEQQAEAGSRGARMALALLKQPERFLATVGVGIELIGTFTAAFGGDQLGEELTTALAGIPALADQEDLRHVIALVLVVLPITFLTLLIGELVPKGLALRHAEGIATFAAPIMTVIARVVRPLVSLLTAAANFVLRLIGQAGEAENPITEEDIVYLVREGTRSGAVEPGEAQVINRVFQFSDRSARNVMTPRPDIVAVEAGTTLAEVVDVFLTSTHSRLPVYQEALDRPVGILYAQDVLRAVSGDSHAAIMSLVRPVAFVFEHQHIDDVLAMFRRQHTQMALVLDEYGVVTGLLTLRDLIEELVGDLPDENDVDEDAAIMQRDENSWLVDGLESLDRVREQTGLPEVAEAERGGYTTLAGAIIARLGRVAAVGDRVQVADYTLEVVDMDARRIDRVLISKQASATPTINPPPSDGGGHTRH